MTGVGMMVGMIYMPPTGPQVSARADGRSNSRSGTCYSGCLFVNDGQEYEVDATDNGVNDFIFLAVIHEQATRIAST